MMYRSSVMVFCEPYYFAISPAEEDDPCNLIPTYDDMLFSLIESLICYVNLEEIKNFLETGHSEYTFFEIDDGHIIFFLNEDALTVESKLIDMYNPEPFNISVELLYQLVVQLISLLAQNVSFIEIITDWENEYVYMRPYHGPRAIMPKWSPWCDLRYMKLPLKLVHEPPAISAQDADILAYMRAAFVHKKHYLLPYGLTGYGRPQGHLTLIDRPREQEDMHHYMVCNLHMGISERWQELRSGDHPYLCIDINWKKCTFTMEPTDEWSNQGNMIVIDR